MPPSKTLLPTTLVGSYAQPDWLINRDKLGKQMPPRVRAADLWRVPLEWLPDVRQANEGPVTTYAAVCTGRLTEPGKKHPGEEHRVTATAAVAEARRSTEETTELTSEESHLNRDLLMT